MTELDRTTQLLWNAQYASESELAFILKRPENRQRDVHYGICTHNDQMDLELSVSPNGNMTVRVATKGFQLSQGHSEAQEDLEPVCWTETDNLAVIRTALSRHHLADNLPAPTIVKAFLDAIDIEKHAICEGGYDMWRTKARILCWNLASRFKQRLEINMIMSRTTCPGLEHTRPWHLPHIECVILDGDDDAIETTPDDEFCEKIQELNAICMPSASSLALRPPFMVRTEHTESFIVSPDSLPWAN